MADGIRSLRTRSGAIVLIDDNGGHCPRHRNTLTEFARICFVLETFEGSCRWSGQCCQCCRLIFHGHGHILGRRVSFVFVRSRQKKPPRDSPDSSFHFELPNINSHCLLPRRLTIKCDGFAASHSRPRLSSTSA